MAGGGAGIGACTGQTCQASKVLVQAHAATQTPTLCTLAPHTPHIVIGESTLHGADDRRLLLINGPFGSKASMNKD